MKTTIRAGLLLLPFALNLPNRVTATSCCTITLPEIRFQVNSTLPTRGILELECLLRMMDAESTLQEINVVLHDNPNIVLELVGHADSEESDQKALSIARAKRVACELVSTYGIEPGRLVAEGKGAEQPRIDERELRRIPGSERVQGHEWNRRVELKVIGFNWVPPHQAELAAVRFLSDPIPAGSNQPNHCDAKVYAPMVDIVDEEYMLPDALLQPSLPANDVHASTSGTTHPDSPAPVILMNPVQEDELTVVWLPGTTEPVRAGILALDGRSIMTRAAIRVQQGARFSLRFPSSLTPGTYLVDLSDDAHRWSLRFVKP